MEDDVDLALQEEMEKLDEMIKLVRRARSADHHDDIEDMVGDKEMLKVMSRVDLDNPDNVEPIADVMRTLPGDVQLEFLMDKFMMTDAEAKDNIVHHHDAVSSDHDHMVKRSPVADPEPSAYGGPPGAFASSSFFSRGSSNPFSYEEEAEPDYERDHYRFRREADHHADVHQQRQQQSHNVDHPPRHHQPHQDSHEGHTRHGKFFKVGEPHVNVHEDGPASVLLQRSAEKHGFQEKLNQEDTKTHQHSQSSQASFKKEPSMAQKISDVISKSRKRRGADELPQKQPAAYLEF